MAMKMLAFMPKTEQARFRQAMGRAEFKTILPYEVAIPGNQGSPERLINIMQGRDWCSQQGVMELFVHSDFSYDDRSGYILLGDGNFLFRDKQTAMLFKLIWA
jgi:hypothetical protein